MAVTSKAHPPISANATIRASRIVNRASLSGGSSDMEPLRCDGGKSHALPSLGETCWRLVLPAADEAAHPGLDLSLKPIPTRRPPRLIKKVLRADGPRTKRRSRTRGKGVQLPSTAARSITGRVRSVGQAGHSN
jgi:hypothetical protein